MIWRCIWATLLAATMKPGVRYRDWRWQFIAATRRALDDRRCTACRVRGVLLDVHHRKAVSQGGGSWLWNLRTLCRLCHEQAHGRSF